MTTEKRKPKNKLNKSLIDLLKPLDITEYGSQTDPCFGKLHDLKAAECQRCGDAEICAIVCSQKMNLDRLKLESAQDFKDVLAPLNTKDEKRKLRKFVKIKLKKYEPEKVARLLHKKFEIPINHCKKFVNKIVKNESLRNKRGNTQHK